MGITRPFGFVKAESKQVVLDTLGLLFDSFPELRRGHYEAFEKMLSQ
jgi:hypothetical protein